MDLEKYANVTNICLFVFGVSFIFWLIKYNWNRRWLYYHASKIDGPFALPIIGSTHHLYIHRKELIRWSTTLFRKYDGSIFKIWLGPSLIILLTRPKDVEVVLKSCLNKPSAYEYTIPLLGRGLITAEVEKWKQHRKLINLTFNQKILNSYVDTFVKHSNILTEKLKTSSGEIQVLPYFSDCILNVISDSLLGLNEVENINNYYALLKRTEELMYSRCVSVLNGIEIYWKFTSGFRELNSFCKETWAFTRKVIERKRRENLDGTKMKTSSKGNFLDHLITMTDKEGKWTQEELMEETQTMIITATDTTINTECFVILMLSMHLDIQQKVYEEISEILGTSNREIDAKDLDQLTYLERVIKETLRLFPIVVMIGRYVDRDVALDSYVIPKDSTVGVPILHIHRNPKIWPDPLKFDPDRFLPGEITKQQQYAFMPFSVPTRNCIGTKFAMMKIKVTIATILRQFELTSSQFKSVKDVKMEYHFVLSSPHFKITLKSR